MHRISIVIPTYENPATIRDTLASAQAQERPAAEIIVVDDGSPTDVAGLVAAAFPEVRVIRHPTNRGVQTARNTGFAAATGDYLLFLDADDLLCPEFLAVAAGQLDAHPETGACFCDFYRFRSGEEESIRAAHQRKQTFDAQAFRPQQGLAFYLENTGAFIPSFTLFRRSALEALCEDGDLFLAGSKLSPNEDFHLFCRLLARNDTMFVRDPLGLYFLHEKSASSNQVNVWSSRTIAADSLISLSGEIGFSPENLSRLKRIRSNAARRHARLIHKAGASGEACDVLRRDIALRFNLKSLALLTTIRANVI